MSKARMLYLLEQKLFGNPKKVRGTAKDIEVHSKLFNAVPVRTQIREVGR